ncbi:MAG: KTSC domain-containing protein [Burkholderiales bacterium]|nr:MAG: KTSC domain-containing protein [Burkholderiales bacterium]
MERRRFNTARLRGAGYDSSAQRLEIEFQDGTVRTYKGVQPEVWRRLIASPNPTSYFDDRIRDEYPNEPGSAAVKGSAARAKLDDLFSRKG